MSFTKYELKEIIMECMSEIFMENSKYKRNALTNKAKSITNKPIVDWMKKYGLWVDSETPAKASIRGWNSDNSSVLFNALWSLNYNPSDSTVSVTADGKTEKIKLLLTNGNRNNSTIIDNHMKNNGLEGVLIKDIKNITDIFERNWKDFVKKYDKNINEKIIQIITTYGILFKTLLNDFIDFIELQFKGVYSYICYITEKNVEAAFACYYDIIFEIMVIEIANFTKVLKRRYEFINKVKVDLIDNYSDLHELIKKGANIVEIALKKIKYCCYNASTYNAIIVNLKDYKSGIDNGKYTTNALNHIIFHEAGHHFDLNNIKFRDKMDMKTFEDFIINNFEKYTTIRGKKIDRSNDMINFLKRDTTKISNDYDCGWMVTKLNRHIPIHDVHISEVIADRFSGKYAKERGSNIGDNRISREDKTRRPSPVRAYKYSEKLGNLGNSNKLQYDENPRLQNFVSSYSKEDLLNNGKKQLNRERASDRRYNRKQKKLDEYLERRENKK